MAQSIIPHNPQNPLHPLQFMFGDDPIRVVQDRDNKPLFVVTDICKALGISNQSAAMQKISDTEKGVRVVYSDGGNQHTVIVTEQGLYRLIFRSDKPRARELQDFIFYEVLPQIMRTGNYINKSASHLDLAEQMLAQMRHQEQEIAALKWQQDNLQTDVQQLDTRLAKVEKRPRKDYDTVDRHLYSYNESPERIAGFEQRALQLSQALGYEVQELEGGRMAFHKDVLRQL